MWRKQWTLLLTWWAFIARGDPPRSLRGGSTTSAAFVLGNTLVPVEDQLKKGESDATWVLTSSFIVLTMQSGFGLLEAGSVDDRFAANIMMKNAVDIIFGGLSYWAMGYGISYGTSFHGLFGTSEFFTSEHQDLKTMAMNTHTVVDHYSHYLFEFTLATTATTIVSGSVAGRLKFGVYMMFSFVNTIQFCVPAHWVYCEQGWLHKWHFVDHAGAGPVHLIGGISGGVGAWMVGPREGRFDKTRVHEFDLANPVNCLFGLFMLWWGWLGVTCGSTFGVTEEKWLVASRVAVATIHASIGGGLFGILSSAYSNKGKIKVESLVSGILSGLVSITAGCAANSPAFAMLIGFVGAGIAQVSNTALLHYCLLDDPVGAVGVHACAAVWGLFCVGLFADSSLLRGPQYNGLFLGGGLKQMGIQMVGIVATLTWSCFSSLLIFACLERAFGLRIPSEAEVAGADVAEHGISLKSAALLAMLTAVNATERGERGIDDEVVARKSEFQESSFKPDVNRLVGATKLGPDIAALLAVLAAAKTARKKNKGTNDTSVSCPGGGDESSSRPGITCTDGAKNFGEGAVGEIGEEIVQHTDNLIGGTGLGNQAASEVLTEPSIIRSTAPPWRRGHANVAETSKETSRKLAENVVDEVGEEKFHSDVNSVGVKNIGTKAAMVELGPRSNSSPGATGSPTRTAGLETSNNKGSPKGSHRGKGKGRKGGGKNNSHPVRVQHF